MVLKSALLQFVLVALTLLEAHLAARHVQPTTTVRKVMLTVRQSHPDSKSTLRLTALPFVLRRLTLIGVIPRVPLALMVISAQKRVSSTCSNRVALKVHIALLVCRPSAR